MSFQERGGLSVNPPEEDAVSTITTFLTFEDQAEAVEFYTSIFPESRIVSTNR